MFIKKLSINVLIIPSLLGGRPIRLPKNHFTLLTALNNNKKRIQLYLLEIDAATGVRVVQPERPGQLLIVGSLPADAHRQQPLPDNVRLSLGQKQ